MRRSLIFCLIFLGGCVVHPSPEIEQLRYEVRTLKGDVEDLSNKLDKTKREAMSASSKAAASAAEVRAIKESADRAAVPTNQERAELLRPREINHETSLLP